MNRTEHVIFALKQGIKSWHEGSLLKDEATYDMYHPTRITLQELEQLRQATNDQIQALISNHF